MATDKFEPPESQNSINDEVEDVDNEENSSESVDKTCVVDRGVAARNYKEIPERLIYSHGTSNDLLYARTPKPYGLVPVQFMPIWTHLPTNAKLPRIPAPKNLFELSRGTVGESLIRPVTNFTLTDELNKDKVVTARYNALHDPHAKSHFKGKQNLTVVKKNELLTSDGNVRCNIEEFNDYRRYLSNRIYLSDVNETYAQTEKVKKFENEQLKKIRKDILKSEGSLKKQDEKVEKAKEFYRKRMEMLKERNEANTLYTNFRAQAHVQMLAEYRENRLLKGIAKEGTIQHKLKLVKRAVEARRKCISQKIIQKEKNTCNFIKFEKERKALERKEFLMDYLSKKCQVENLHIQLADKTKKSVAATLKQQAMKRQIKIDASRASMPARMAARVLEAKRIEALVRKFFYRWLENVRKRKARRPDEFHQSFWEVHKEVDVTVKFLRQESGYEKFDDFIMNIVKLKRNIRADLVAEEETEVALALGIHKKSQQLTQPEEEARNEAIEPTTVAPSTDISSVTSSADLTVTFETPVIENKEEEEEEEG